MHTIRATLTTATILTGLFVVTLTAAAQPGDVFTSRDGKYSARFPGKPKENSQTTRSTVGELTVYTATFATTEGSVYLVSYTDFPVNTLKAENHAALYDGVRDGLKKDGKLLSEKDLTIGAEKLAGREIVIDKGKQQLRFRVTARGDRLYQVAAVGSGEFVTGKDATAFLDSFEVSR